HTAIPATNIPTALGVLQSAPVDLVISDYRMPHMSGLEFLELLRSEGYQTPVIILTAIATVENAVAAIKAGALDYLTKPFRAEQLEVAVTQALKMIELRKQNEALRAEVMAFRNERQIIGESSAIQQTLDRIGMVAPSRASVLLIGESGTGKELVARAIHGQSDRRDGPFVAVNCAAIAESLLESQLFGHEKGAFTGAIKRFEGAFERAHGGTLLLDEISEMRLDLQSKLLRALQEHEVDRVGGSAPIKVDVRVIATTNRDIDAYVRDGKFREDLFYRLNVFPIVLPPLRDRRQDIPLLAMRFAMRTAKEMGKAIEGFAPGALAMLQSYDWPGNVRELQGTIERAVIVAKSTTLEPADLDGMRHGMAGRGPSLTPRYGMSVVPGVAPAAPAASALPEGAIALTSLDVAEAERTLIHEALRRTGGNRTRAAELLGLSIRTLRNKLNGTSVADLEATG
ncbi:MAG TPA: sigma-54 dependent transcriptional regulator, partial [Gemmatimonadaceae bacterium]|nr:sigma-54 dependent transcriptional regulator [Gemmatimonadaceae bacterium]